MQYKFLTTLLFSTLALAAPPAESDIAVAISSIPSSIYTVLATAVPFSWYEELQNPASRSSIISEARAGTMPAWYNSLPASVKAWATSAGGFADNLVGATPTATASAGASAGTGAGSGSGSEGVSTSTPIATTTGSPSSTHSSSSSTGGAPVATGGVAMSLAGAAGLLGLAIAL